MSHKGDSLPTEYLSRSTFVHNRLTTVDIPGWNAG